MCEFCGLAGRCCVCGHDHDAGLDASTDDPLLLAAVRGRAAARAGEPYSNPYPAGSLKHLWFGGAYLDAAEVLT